MELEYLLRLGQKVYFGLCELCEFFTERNLRSLLFANGLYFDTVSSGLDVLLSPVPILGQLANKAIGLYSAVLDLTIVEFVFIGAASVTLGFLLYSFIKWIFDIFS